MLTSKLVPIVAIHSLRGSRANRHHTPNPQLGASQPTQDKDHTSHEQSTRLHFGSPTGKGQEPLTITMIEARDNHLPPLDDPHSLSHLGGGNHQEKQANPTTKHNHQVSLDAITQAMHLDSLPISQDDKSMMEMSVRALAKLTRLLCQYKWPRE